MSGYANRVVRIGFPELTEPDEDELFVVIRNPKTVPPDDLTPEDLPVDPNTGMPLDMDLASQRSREVIAKLVVAWRVYDATDFAVDDNGDPVDQQPLPLPATPELVRRLPMEIVRTLNERIGAAFDPK